MIMPTEAEQLLRELKVLNHSADQLRAEIESMIEEGEGGLEYILPTVFTLAPLDPVTHLPVQPPENSFMFRKTAQGRVQVESFPDESDICPHVVDRLAIHHPGLVRLEGERLYIHAANGEAVYVPIGPSKVQHCTRYGRLFWRLPDS
jgi:hypothetical protein